MTTSIHRHLWRACARAGVLLSLSVATACSNSLGPAGPAGDTGGTGATTSSGGGGASGSGGAGAGGAGGTGATSGAGGAQGGTQQPGAPVIANKAAHRLSNTEYDNTVRDLLQTDSRFGDAFVAEEAEGFDNIATALSMSPRQVEDYFAAARTVSASVFADPALRARIVPCDPAADAACADTVITTFGRRAFRRPLEASESAGLAAKYQEARALGVDPMGALQHVVHVVLASPQFLYRIELDPDLADTAPHPVSGYELASRLSYALWSSTPDDALLARAESGELLQPDALAIEVNRMLDDSRSAMLVENFAAQWFGARRLSEHIASSSAFPTWNAELGASMRREMELYFSEFLYGSLSYGDFLTTDMNFVDGALAAHYGMAPPSGAGFQRVVVTTDQRQGLLGLAGFLTHTSRETRSSPIIRGKWILDAVWCQELRLPPNLVVEPLPDPVEGDPPTTVREQMAVHRADDACAGCHDSIDPIGLALENFDAIGRYRAVYENGLPIDTVGTLPEGQSVDGLASLSAALAQDPQFLACAAHKFGTYSLGLAMANENRDQIVTRWTSGTPTLRSLLKETVRHEMFRTRRAEGP